MAAIAVAVAESTEKVMRDGPARAPGGELTLAAARNEHETGQLVLRAAEPLADVRVRIGDLVHDDGDARIAAASVELLAQHYVHVEQPTTPAFAPGWYPDALPAHDAPLALVPDRNQSLWVKLHVPEEAPPGVYRGRVVVTAAERELAHVAVTLRVWDLVLPAAGSSRSAFAIWYDQVAAHYGAAPGSDAALELAERFYEFQLRHRLPPDDLPIRAGLTAGAWLEAAAPYLADPRVSCFRIPFDARDVARTRAIVAALRARGQLGGGYFYLDEIDEPTAGGHAPTEGGHPRVRELCQLMERIAPGVPHVVTAEPVPDLAGAVRTWCPLLDRVDSPYARERRAAGDAFWWYGCIFPTHPYPSYHVDDDLAGARLLPWMMRRDGIDGNLYWATTIFGRWDGERFVDRDPWTDPVAWPGADGRGGGANGDGQLIYPGADGPVSTIRLEAIREGLEDHEHLVLLEDALRACAARLGVDGFDPAVVIGACCDALFASVSEFTRDAALIAAVRAAVAEHTVRLADPAAALIVANRVSAERCRLDVWAPPGTTVAVDGRRLDGAEAGGAGGAGGGRHVHVAVELDAEDGCTPLVVTEHAGRRAEQRSFVPAWRGEEPPRSASPLPLDAASWTAANGRLAVDGDALAFESEPAGEGEDRPRLRTGLDPERDGLDATAAIELDVEHRGERSIALFVRFEDRDGRAHDALRAMVVAGSRETVRVPLRLALLDPAAIVALEVGVMAQQPAAQLSLTRPRVSCPA